MPPLVIIGLILALSVLSFWLAGRLRLPSVLVLLASGALLGWALGPEVARSDLDPILPTLLGSALALIFFEGGRNLSVQPLGQDAGLVGHLVGWGAKVGWLGMSALAHFVLGLPATESLICGGVLMLSAPYMVEPLIERLGGSPRMALILHWEAFLLSCIGVVWTVLMVEALAANQGEPALLKTIGITLLNALIGVAMGLVGTGILRVGQRIPPPLQDPLAVAVAFLCFGLSQAIYWGSGLVAAISLGYLDRSRATGPEPGQNFWPTLRLLNVGILAVCLGMFLPRAELLHHWPYRLTFALLVVLVVRPLLVKIGARHGLNPQERLLLTLSWPRGAMMLAATVLISHRLVALGHPESARLVSVACWVVLVSLLVPWILGPWLLKPQGSDEVAA